jgi:hypothetical protein
MVGELVGADEVVVVVLVVLVVVVVVVVVVDVVVVSVVPGPSSVTVPITQYNLLVSKSRAGDTGVQLLKTIDRQSPSAGKALAGITLGSTGGEGALNSAAGERTCSAWDEPGGGEMCELHSPECGPGVCRGSVGVSEGLLYKQSIIAYGGRTLRE